LPVDPAAIVVRVFQHHRLYYSQSREERSAMYAALGDDATGVAAAVDLASASCAGYATSVMQDRARDAEGALIDLRKIKVLEDEEVFGWLSKYGQDKPLFSAHIYSLEVLRRYLIAYYESQLPPSA
jgi:hypothetical protein